MKKVFITLLILSAVFATQYVPLPKREVGILIGKADAPVKVQLIYDPVCDGSAAFDVTFQKAFDALTTDIKQQISLRFISLSLPYHMASQKLTQGIIYVLDNKGNQQALRLFRDFLSDVNQYSQQTIKNSSVNDLMRKIALRINTLFGLKTEDVLKQLAHYSKTDGRVRQWSKVQMGSMKVAGTPTLRINGVRVDGATDMTSQQLTDLLKSFFTATQESVLLD